ncbi:helix-turn-helix transcriptional regulator [Arthrobacter antibioticus]|uniref:helix-turn-helix transcriptional regulator n=1 Tax=Arthrobacter sp. H35-MC1 TaxID=3046203 RepID=UPI0024B905CE|nr:helix-turn-helix domain-containing protein [Arthrobacter sp. H35-MC1]MDJ0318668.1 helix-turn-helix domain-containing protein [Arthrobacter sp. H35-MC1]
MTETRPKWTMREAVERTGASRSTLRRRLDQGKFPGAYLDRAGQWRIPLTDLLAAGFIPVPPLGQGVVTDIVHPEDALAQVNQINLENRIKTLEISLATERAHRVASEQVALAHEKRAETAERALLMLESGLIRTPAAPGPQVEKEESARRPAHWWNRLR